MRQLALDVKLADYARFESYFAGPNRVAVQALEQMAGNSAELVIWLWGAAGAGRSHLLQAAIAAAAESDRACAWLPLAHHDELASGMLEGMGSLDLVCIDDIDAIAGLPDWEQQLFRLFEELREQNASLVVSASAAPASVGFELKDLQSRLASGPVWKLLSLSDTEQIQALQLRARWRGFELPDETGRYLLRRVERSSEALFAVLDELDSAALREQRRLTIPFVKEVLQLSD
jgi:DnaA family protein